MTTPSNFEASDYEPDSPFINETVFTDDAVQAFQSQNFDSDARNRNLVSPYLNTLESMPDEDLEVLNAEKTELDDDEIESYNEEFFYEEDFTDEADETEFQRRNFEPPKEFLAELEAEEKFYGELEAEAEFDEEAEEEAFAELWSEEEELELEPEVEWERSNVEKNDEEEYWESRVAWNHFHEEEEDLYEDDESGFEAFSNDEEELELEYLEALANSLDQNEDFAEELEYKELIEEELKVFDKPTPGRFYRIKKGDNLLKIAGEAYGVGSGKRRLAFAQFINAQPFNQRYLIKSKKDFIKKHFSGEIISFFPKFSCNDRKLIKARNSPPRGKCFAVIWIPPKKVNFHPRFGKGKSIPLNLFESEVQRNMNTGRKIKLFREIIKDTKEPPFKWICAIGVVYADPDDPQKVISFGVAEENFELSEVKWPPKGNATGLLIGSRHVLTAAHNIYHWINGSKGTPGLGMAKRIVVIPGLNIKNDPFGAYKAASKGRRVDAEVPDQWKGISPFRGQFSISPNISQTESRYDYALIRLEKDIGFNEFDGEQLGWWGMNNDQFRIASHSADSLEKDGIRDIGISGYPKDKKSAQVLSNGKIHGVEIGKLNPLENTFLFSAILKKGNSGSPIWLSKNIDGKIIYDLIGIHLESFIGHRNSCRGVLLTPQLVRQINKWKKKMGGS